MTRGESFLSQTQGQYLSFLKAFHLFITLRTWVWAISHKEYYGDMMLIQ